MPVISMGKGGANALPDWSEFQKRCTSALGYIPSAGAALNHNELRSLGFHVAASWLAENKQQWERCARNEYKKPLAYDFYGLAAK